MKKRKILYEKWREIHEQDKERAVIGSAIGAAPERIVVRKVTVWMRLFQIIWDIVEFILKFFLVMTLLTLLTLSIVVLMNEPLRNAVFEFLQRYIR